MLDADDNPLVDKYGKKMSRDIVQFVPLREFQTRTGANFSLVHSLGINSVCALYIILMHNEQRRQDMVTWTILCFGFRSPMYVQATLFVYSIGS